MFTNTNTPWMHNQTSRSNVFMDEEDNSCDTIDSHSQYTIVSQKMVSCIEKSQNKMITFQRTFCDQQQNYLANIDNDINTIKEKLSIFDLIQDRVKNQDIPSITQELCKIQGQFELTKKETDNANGLQKENKEIIMRLYDQAMILQNTVSNQSTDLGTLKVRMDTLENEVKKLYNVTNEHYVVLDKKIELNIKKMNIAFKNLQSSCQNEIAELRADVLDKKIDNSSQGLNQKRFKSTAQQKSKDEIAALRKKYQMYQDSEGK